MYPLCLCNKQASKSISKSEDSKVVQEGKGAHEVNERYRGREYIFVEWFEVLARNKMKKKGFHGE